MTVGHNDTGGVSRKVLIPSETWVDHGRLPVTSSRLIQRCPMWVPEEVRYWEPRTYRRKYYEVADWTALKLPDVGPQAREVQVTMDPMIQHGAETSRLHLYEGDADILYLTMGIQARVRGMTDRVRVDATVLYDLLGLSRSKAGSFSSRITEVVQGRIRRLRMCRVLIQDAETKTLLAPTEPLLDEECDILPARVRRSKRQVHLAINPIWSNFFAQDGEEFDFGLYLRTVEQCPGLPLARLVVQYLQTWRRGKSDRFEVPFWYLWERFARRDTTGRIIDRVGRNGPNGKAPMLYQAIRALVAKDIIAIHNDRELPVDATPAQLRELTLTGTLARSDQFLRERFLASGMQTTLLVQSAVPSSLASEADVSTEAEVPEVPEDKEGQSAIAWEELKIADEIEGLLRAGNLPRQRMSDYVTSGQASLPTLYWTVLSAYRDYERKVGRLGDDNDTDPIAFVTTSIKNLESFAVYDAQPPEPVIRWAARNPLFRDYKVVTQKFTALEPQDLFANSPTITTANNELRSLRGHPGDWYQLARRIRSELWETFDGTTVEALQGVFGCRSITDKPTELGGSSIAAWTMAYRNPLYHLAKAFDSPEPHKHIEDVRYRHECLQHTHEEVDHLIDRYVKVCETAGVPVKPVT